MAITIGQIILTRYRVDAFIASGGMGAVYRIWDQERSVPLAMKVLHADLAEDPSIYKRFQREARALQKLAHPNIVPFYGLFQTQDFAFLLERFIDGPSLKDILKRRQGQSMPVPEALIYHKALCAALGYAHAHGVVHCDVKPGNVMVDQGGNIYLTDFGVARHAESTTTTLGTIGTAAYMAPEQIRGEAVSPATDVYALGVVLFEMLTGQRPFRGKAGRSEGSGPTHANRIYQAHLSQPPPDPRSLNSDMPGALAETILKSLSKDPRQRYQSTTEFLTAVCAAVGVRPENIPDRANHNVPSGMGVVAEKTPRVAASPSSLKKTRTPVLLGAAGALLVSGLALMVCLIITFSVRGNRIPEPTDRAILAENQGHTPRQNIATATHRLPPAPTKTPSPQPVQAVVASPTGFTSPTEIPRPTKTPRATSPPTIPACPGAIRSQIRVGMQAHVCTQSDRLITREEPRPGNQEAFRLYPGTEILVVGGPECIDGSNWWQIQVGAGTTVRYGEDYSLPDDQMVWVREGSDSVDPYYICPSR